MKKTLIGLIGLATLLVACNKQEPVRKAPGAVTIEPVITRATETNFENGDRIGLTVLKGTETYADNASLTYNGTAFKGDLTWYEEDEASTLKAYYPYQDASVPTTFTVAADQSAGIASSDFLSAVKEDVKPTENTVAMVFKHQLVRFVIALNNQSGGTVDGITIQDAVLTAAIDPGTLTASAAEGAAAGSIKAYPYNGGYYVILPPQTAALTVVVTVDGVERSQKLVTNTYGTGKEYRVSIGVGKDKIAVVLSGEIENWTDGGEVVADEGEEDETDENFSDDPDAQQFTYYGTTYKTTTLKDGKRWMAEPMAYVPEGLTVSSNPAENTGIWYPYVIKDGAAEPVTDGSLKGYLYDYPTAFGVDAVDTENWKSFEGIRGICPKGWHVPTRADYFALVGYSLKSQDETAAQTNEDACYYFADYNAGSISLLNADGFGFAFLGTRNQTAVTVTGAYAKNAVSTSETFKGLPSLNYLICSTPYMLSATEEGFIKNIQYFALMSTFTTTYPEGRLHLAYAGYLGGYQLRCVKD